MQTVSKSTVEHLADITKDLMKRSGYPYPPGSAVDPNLALAYGIAVGSLMWARRELEASCQSKKL